MIWYLYLSQLWALLKKELLAILKDPASRAILFAPALIQSFLFGYAATYDLHHVPYAVLDQSQSVASRSLMARVEGTGVFYRVATLNSSTQIAHEIDSSHALMVIHIPSDFEARLSSGDEAPVQLILDSRNSSTAGLVANYLGSIVTEFNEARGVVTSGLFIERRAWFNPNLESRWFLMPGLMATLSMIQTLLLAALSVAREREQGTFDPLLVTPLTPTQILIGKALPAVGVGLMQSTIIFFVVRFWFEVPISGSLLLLYASLTLFTVASVGIGLSISAFALTMQQAMLYAFLFIMPMMLLSGLLTPVENMPVVLQWLTTINPLRFGLSIVRRIYLEGAGCAEIAMDCLPLVLIMAVTLPLATWLFRNRLS